MKLIPFLQPLDSDVRLPLRFHLFLTFITLRWQSRIARKASVASFCDTAFSLLLGGECHFVTSMVSRLNSLPGSECRSWKNLSWTLSVIIIDLSLASCDSLVLWLKSLPVRCNASNWLEPPYFGSGPVYCPGCPKNNLRLETRIKFLFLDRFKIFMARY